MAELEWEVRRELRRVVDRFPTGEIRTTEGCGLVWIDEAAEAFPPDGYVYASISTHAPEARELNIRRKRS